MGRGGTTGAQVPTLKFRLRVLRGEVAAFGPGKADLLVALERTGSLVGAARALDMSYMRAWTLVREMNAAFRSPLVESTRGGSGGGHADVTPFGREVLALYREMVAASHAAAEPAWSRLKRRIAK